MGELKKEFIYSYNDFIDDINDSVANIRQIVPAIYNYYQENKDSIKTHGKGIRYECGVDVEYSSMNFHFDIEIYYTEEYKIGNNDFSFTILLNRSLMFKLCGYCDDRIELGFNEFFSKKIKEYNSVIIGFFRDGISVILDDVLKKVSNKKFQ